MKTLEESRIAINEVDAQIVELFEKRMDIVKDVYEFKKANNMQILDASREALVIEKNVKLLKNKEYEAYYIQFLKDMMNVSKDMQKDLMDKK